MSQVVGSRSGSRLVANWPPAVAEQVTTTTCMAPCRRNARSTCALQLRWETACVRAGANTQCKKRLCTSALFRMSYSTLNNLKTAWSQLLQTELHKNNCREENRMFEQPM